MKVKVRDNASFKELRGKTVWTSIAGANAIICVKNGQYMTFSYNELENEKGISLEGKLKVGDTIKISRPKTEKERRVFPTWTTGMDRYDGKVGEVRHIFRNFKGNRIKIKHTHLNFLEEWCEKVEK
jgi:hypothetical protein